LSKLKPDERLDDSLKTEPAPVGPVVRTSDADPHLGNAHLEGGEVSQELLVAIA
jgi:hypothetical protein